MLEPDQPYGSHCDDSSEIFNHRLLHFALGYFARSARPLTFVRSPSGHHHGFHAPSRPSGSSSVLPRSDLTLDSCSSRPVPAAAPSIRALPCDPQRRCCGAVVRGTARCTPTVPLSYTFVPGPSAVSVDTLLAHKFSAHCQPVLLATVFSTATAATVTYSAALS